MQENQTHQPNQKQPNKTNAVSKSKYLEWILILLIFTLFGLFFWEQKQLDEFQRVNSRDSTEIAIFREKLLKAQDQIRDLTEKLKVVESHQKTESKAVIQIDSTQDIADLIRWAQQFLVLQRNRDFALKALYMAKDQTSQLEGGEALKKAIDKDIQILEAIDMPKQEELIEKLSNLAQTVGKLSMIKTFAAPKQSLLGPELTHLNYWEKLKHTAFNLVKKAVVVTHEPGNIQSFVPNSTYWVSQLQILLTQAQWAVFLQQQTSYQKSLEQAIQLVQQYFVQDERVKEMLNQLNALKAITLNPALPDLSHLMNSLPASTSPKTRADSIKEKKQEPSTKGIKPLEQGVLSS